MFIYSMQESHKGANHETLGNKGFNLIDMNQIGIPIPFGFILNSRLCEEYLKNNSNILNKIMPDIKNEITKIENKVNLKFGDKEKPLLFSVRSGASISMPGMMDTVLNLGINDEILEGMSKLYNKRFALDTYRRFIQMYGNIIMGVQNHYFEECIEDKKIQNQAKEDKDLNEHLLIELINEYKEIIHKQTSSSIPNDPYVQLELAIKAVFNSWNNKRAVKYRMINNIPNNMFTAVNVQMMVYGNINDESGTGVLFSRNPSNGDKELFGDYLINAQGEDVVSGTRNTNSICANGDQSKKGTTLEEKMPEIFKELKNIAEKLEKYYKNIQDIEFTIQNGKLYILQTRNGKCSIKATININYDLMTEGIITQKELISRIPIKNLNEIIYPTLDPIAQKNIICNGLAASPGAACGVVVFNTESMKAKDIPYILVRTETNPEDIEGMNIANGILTARGGITSHAAVVARGMGKPCVCGASAISINYNKKIFTTENGHTIKEGDYITIDGGTGEVINGQIRMIQADLPEKFFKILKIAKQFSNIKVYANADTVNDIAIANKMHTDGIGLCRTEHMFFDSKKINYLRQAIVIKNTEKRKSILETISKLQQEDFYNMIKEIKEKPFNIRLLDPPLHEFIPKDENGIKELSKISCENEQDIKNIITKLHETNPMLGNRGCRIGIINSDIYETQINAIFNAIYEAIKNDNITPNIGIMVPLISKEKEIKIIKEMIIDLHKKIQSKFNAKIPYRIGVMIELPSSAITADKIAKHVDFFSFGTNDLTQTTLGISRDDTATLIDEYIRNGIIENDPFQVLDEENVGELIKLATKKGREANQDIEVGICGEHGGNYTSSKFLYESEMNYTSCSPYRIPTMIISNAMIKCTQDTYI